MNVEKGFFVFLPLSSPHGFKKKYNPIAVNLTQINMIGRLFYKLITHAA